MDTAMDKAAQETIDDFKSSLADLTVNSRPLIGMLTVLADENKKYAPAVVEAVEAHLLKVPPTSKLAVFYLIDSICKNLKKFYADIFKTNLVSNFCTVFEVVDEKTRASMFKLRSSWNSTFPATKLYALDARVQLLDPAWPIAQMPVSKGSSIHVNPKFLAGAAPVASAEEPKMQSIVMEKQRELLELQKQKVALELLKAKASVQSNTTVVQTPANVVRNTSRIAVDSAPKPHPSINQSSLSLPSILLKPSVNASRTVIRPSTMTAVRPPAPAFQSEQSPSKDPRMVAKAKAEARPQKIMSPDIIVLPEKNLKSKKESPGKRSSSSSKKSSSSSSSSSSKSRSPSSSSIKSSKSKKESSSKKKVPEGKFKDIKSIHLRNYVRKARSVSSSPEPPAAESSKGEQKKSEQQDIDLRTLGSPTGKKRGSTPEKGAAEQAPSPKRSKQAEMLDELFGHEDVDLRQLSAPVRAELKRAPDWTRFKETNPDTYRSPLKNCNWENGSDISLSDIEIAPPPPPPKIIIPEELKISPATVSPLANRRSGDFDSLGRPLLHLRLSEESKERRRTSSTSEDIDLRTLFAEMNDDGQDNSEKITMMIAQADEQLNNGTLNMTEYKTLLKEVVQLNEANKLREAKRRDEQENWSDPTWQDEDSRGDNDPRNLDVDERYPSHRRDFLQHHRGGRGFNRGGRWGGGDMRMGWDGGWQQNRMPFNRGPRGAFPRPPGDFGPRSWNNQQGFPFPPMHPGMRPRGSQPDLPQADPLELETARANFPRTIAIDGLNRDVRYYGDETIILMSYDDPRDISFYPAERAVEFENGFKVVMTIGAGPKDVMIRNSMHRIKLGVPTRELNIDGKDYECYYGGSPVQVELNGMPIRVQLEGPPPRVKISDYRRLDYCAGKITMVIDAVARVPIYLDATPQIVHIDSVPHVVRFIDAFRRVLINGQPFVFDYGGLPQPIFVHGRRHYIGLTALPPCVTPGYITIMNMEGSRLPSPPKDEPPKVAEKAVPEEFTGHSPALPMVGVAKGKKGIIPEKAPPEQRKAPVNRSILNTKPQLDVISNLIPAAPSTSTNGHNYELHKEQEMETSAPAVAPDLAELLAKLNEYGILQSINAVEAKKKEETEKKEEYKPVTLNSESLRVRQVGSYSGLYCGIQCSTCGLRFPPEQTLRYSQHLDWHFRQNRRDKDSAKKAQSRKWYYDVSDWIQFEEIEDLEERAQSWFETQAEEDKVEEGEAEIPTVIAKDGEVQEQCEVCHEAFETFFLQEKEEWHLRDAVRVDDKVYHPHCYQDLQNALEKTAESTDLNETNGDEEMKEEQMETEGEKEEEPESKEEEGEGVKKEDEEEKDVKDKEKVEAEEPMEQDKHEEEKEEEVKEGEENEKIEVAEEKKEETSEVVEPAAQVKIKEEPMEAEPCKDSGFFSQDMAEVKTEPVEPEEEEVPEQHTVDTTKMEFKSSIDGNVELQEAPAKLAAPAGKIKITITTPAPALPETKKEEDEPETPSIEEPIRVALKETDYELKPRLKGRKLTEMPPVMKGREDSALCSIM
ncbi:uncharacterized protein LOC132201872 isoform X2 [Neocloeon triangulifer]|uniref:uncharacterized protein LOC132201872 isoform X2 n=1 Tax=Neocloeon triangulifer TaxID=2078957 RepID=UPI00286F2BAF|nr:uncharacterized protein LOC132201872 isoform X2 [Neocloeon triangulifer]